MKSTAELRLGDTKNAPLEFRREGQLDGARWYTDKMCTPSTVSGFEVQGNIGAAEGYG